MPSPPWYRLCLYSPRCRWCLSTCQSKLPAVGLHQRLLRGDSSPLTSIHVGLGGARQAQPQHYVVHIAQWALRKYPDQLIPWRMYNCWCVGHHIWLGRVPWSTCWANQAVHSGALHPPGVCGEGDWVLCCYLWVRLGGWWDTRRIIFFQMWFEFC